MEINGIAKNSPAPQAGQASSAEDKRMRKACVDFESMLVSQMLKAMRNTVPKSDLFGSGDQEEMFQEMLDQQVSADISERGSMGIADLMYKQLKGQEK